MKTQKKLTLNKQTVSKLTDMDEVKGGLTPIIVTYLASCFRCETIRCNLII